MLQGHSRIAMKENAAEDTVLFCVKIADLINIYCSTVDSYDVY